MLTAELGVDLPTGLEMENFQPDPLTPPPMDEPSPTKLVTDGHRMREFLLESGRSHAVSMGMGDERLTQAGVYYSWWLGPHEAIASEDGSAWPNGAFVYLYAEGDEHLDCVCPDDGSEAPCSQAGTRSPARSVMFAASPDQPSSRESRGSSMSGGGRHASLARADSVFLNALNE